MPDSRSRPGVFKRIFSSSSPARNRGEILFIPPQMAQIPRQPQTAVATGSGKLAAVTGLIDKLYDDLTDVNLLPQQRDEALEELKVYGRDPRNADPIFTRKGIETLTRHAFNSPSSTTSRNALRCLCNALLLHNESRQTFVDLSYGANVVRQLGNDNRDDEFLASRLLFLTTYADNVNLVDLIDNHHLADNLVRNLERHARSYTAAKLTTDPMAEMALAETLKLLFNVTHHCKDRSIRFTPAVPPVVTLLCRSRIKPEKPLNPPVNSIVNALLNLDLGAKDSLSALYPQGEADLVVNCLIDLLTRSSQKYEGEELENTVTPLIGVIRAVHEYAPEDIRNVVRQRLLPTEADRNQALGRSESLPSWLLRNSTNPLTPQLREAISDLLFDMSGKDASKFVKNVGYGFASGFLYNRNLSIPQNASEAYSIAQGGADRPINPVTGQFLDAERQPNVPEMTEEEKEREAERLFVLFERLRANGIISAENPVRTAQQSGRFEELPDDYGEDVD